MTGSTNLTTVKPSDMAISADGTRLYAAGDDGKVRIYDLATRTLIQTWAVGNKLGGIDLSNDGSFLLVTERQSNGAWAPDNVYRSTSVVYKLDLSTGAVTSYSIVHTGDSRTFYDVAVLATGEVLLTQDAYSAWLPLWKLDLASGQFTASVETYTVSSTLEASADRSHVLLAQGNISDAPIFLYEGGNGIVRAHKNYQDGVQGYNYGVFAINEGADLIVQNAGGRLYVYDSQLNFQFDLSALHPGYYLGTNIGGVAFDSTGANLYLLSGEIDAIIQIDTSDWHVVRTFDVGADVGDSQGGGFGNRLNLSPDGTTFIVSTASGIQLIANHSSTSGLPGQGQTTGGAGDDVLQGGYGGDSLIGDAGGDTIFGNGGRDLIYSHRSLPTDYNLGYPYQPGSGDIYAERDDLSGGAGDDILFAGYGDGVDGGAGYDSLAINFRGATSGVVADFRPLAAGSSVTVGGALISEIERVYWIDGSEQDDFLAAWAVPYPNPDGGGVINGRGGNDHLIASLGIAALYGGDGNDVLDLRTASAAGYGEAGDDYIIGGADYEFLYGGDGNDRIEGNSGFDIISGGIGNDVVDGGGFHDTLRGDGGDDLLYGAGDSDWLYGGVGNDILRGDYSPLGSVNLLSPSYNADQLFGEDGNDELHGDQGNDILDGGAGDDRLSGGAGSDSYAGGEGIDSIDFSGEAGPVVVNLHHRFDLYPEIHPLATRPVAPGEALDSYGNYERLSGIENVVTTGQGDQILGSDGANRIETGAGDDIVVSEGGNDTVIAGDGADAVAGGDGDDWIEGGAGDDNVEGGAGADRIEGGPGNDLLRANGGNDILLGGEGNDNLRGGAGVDSYDGGANDEVLNYVSDYGDRVSFADPTATQGAVADLRTGLISNDGFGNSETMAGIESLGAGTAFADTLYGNDNRNFLWAAMGDSLYGFGGDDVIRLSGAAALADGGSGIDTLELDAFATLAPDSNGDGWAESIGPMTVGWTVDLGAGTSVDGYGNNGAIAGFENLRGSHLGDIIHGSGGANVIDGGEGADSMSGGLGDDVYVVDDAGDVVTENGGEGTDEVRTGLGTGSTQPLRIAAQYQLGANVENLTGTGLNQGLRGNALNNVIAAGSGSDFINLSDGGNDTVAAGDGRDVLYYGGALTSADSNDAGSAGGDVRGDLLILQGDYSEGVTLGPDAIAGVEKLRVLRGNNADFGDTAGNHYSYEITTVDSNVARDGRLVVQAGSLRIGETLSFDGSDESDGSFQVFGGRDGDRIEGGSQSDHLLGRAGDDELIGNGGNDRLRGGLGQDSLEGGAGADIFVYSAQGGAEGYANAVLESTSTGYDILVGFDYGEDEIDLPNAVTSLSTDSTGKLDSASFDADLTSALGSFQAGSAVLFTPDGGDLIGRKFLIVDANGDGAYQANSDFVFEIRDPAGTLPATPDFFI